MRIFWRQPGQMREQCALHLTIDSKPAGFTTAVSSRRYKEDIRPMDKASEALLALKPVAFPFKGELDPSYRPQWEFITEEVEKVNRDLVDLNNRGEIESVPL